MDRYVHYSLTNKIPAVEKAIILEIKNENSFNTRVHNRQRLLTLVSM